MNWQCNYCGNRTQPVKEVEIDGMDYPAGRACYKCGKGEMVYCPIEPQPKVCQLIELIK